MTSLEIINLTLARLGAQQATSLADTNKNPRLAVQAYAFAKDEVLRFHPWPCIVARKAAQDEIDIAWVTLTPYVTGDIISNYDAAASTHTADKLYVCITSGTTGATRPSTTSADITDGSAHWKYIAAVENLTDYDYQYIIPANCLRVLEVGDASQYLREGPFIYTDEEDPTIRYVKESTDPEEWDNFIHEAIALRTAQMICEAVTGSASMAQMLQQEYMQVLVSGMGIAQGEASEEPEHETRWEEA